MIQLEAEPNDLFVIQVYMPTSRADDEEIEEVYAGIEELLKLTKGKDNVVIMGDWNAVVGEGKDGREMEKYNKHKKPYKQRIKKSKRRMARATTY